MCTMLTALVHLKRLSLVETANPHAHVAEQSTNGKHYEAVTCIMVLRVQSPIQQEPAVTVTVIVKILDSTQCFSQSVRDAMSKL